MKRFKPGQAVEVLRAGFFGASWVKAAYFRQIGDYHTVHEYGGSFVDAYIRATTLEVK